jgi:hypothetical protein
VFRVCFALLAIMASTKRQKSPKKLRKLKKLAEVYRETVYKSVKASGTRWIDHKVRATKVFLENYGMYVQHLEQVRMAKFTSLHHR